MSSSSPPAFLQPALANLKHSPPPDRPHVTLTFAQSLDAKIAGQHGKQLILSGKESMVMTHWLRTMHDGIIVGIGTALNDDPQLNTRHLPPRLDSQPHSLPRPIILDPRLRLSPECKLLKNFQAKTGRRPWVLSATPTDDDRPDWQQRYDALSQAGASIVQLELSSNILPVPVVLEKLRRLGINSLMVEGGARIIDSFLNACSFIDTLLVTVAPTLVGSHGVAYGTNIPTGISHLRHFDTQAVGNDAVIILKSEKS
ncbi:dihydrofolate reductase [Macrolepiota fuliginosa MF-IS2]|uniref:2,5-diamino-6-ribosylamino-4(3H)-pyrimidinone 5'-phosphate reductase n=1 Tax=Macrolepiota fuliginosa MF-IS2 TaxID=1400762 RepID=A0A9P6C6L8_9AGAR|nr:dihydrofolate reductase [Macrolepiota fuliginosa MF-IS2]